MKVLLGVTSSIAVYKALDLVSMLRKAGHEIAVIMSENARKMVSEIPFHSLSSNIVYYDQFKEKDYIPHISLSDWADVFVVAPATANIIGKMANGIADDLLSTAYISVNKPVLVAPAMNVKMLEHPAVQKNIQSLRERGVCFVEPAEGMLACGYAGKGKLAPVEEIFNSIVALEENAEKPLQGKKVLVSAGGTIEDIDPVRYITNRSSGRMGIAFAEQAKQLGADVTLIYADVAVELPSGINTIEVRSALDMLTAIKKEIESTDILVMAAAVADYRPEAAANQKIKKTGETLELKLVKNPDLLMELSKSKKEGQIFIGFALETQNLLENARSKMERKNLDMIVANSPENFNSSSGRVQILKKDGAVKSLEMLEKNKIASTVFALIQS